jgi:predicted  nucleic acid-binding Zn-ribbon protein
MKIEAICRENATGVKALNDKYDALQKVCDNWKKEAEALAKALNLKKTDLDTTANKIVELNKEIKKQNDDFKRKEKELEEA